MAFEDHCQRHRESWEALFEAEGAVSREMPFHLSLQQSSTELHRCLIAKDHPPEHAVLAAERGEQLVAALLKLLEEERTAIVLKHLQPKTVSESPIIFNGQKPLWLGAFEARSV